MIAPLRIFQTLGGGLLWLWLWHQQRQPVATAFAAPSSQSFVTTRTKVSIPSMMLTTSQPQSSRQQSGNRFVQHPPTTSSSSSVLSFHSIRSRRVSALIPRGGATTASILSSITTSATSSPAALFHSSLLSLAAVTIAMKVLPILASNTNKKTRTESSSRTDSTATTTTKPPHVLSLQIRFLLVFWLLRCADWLQGPYFYEVYASKAAASSSAAAVSSSMSIISQLFLTGFASRAILGPSLGRWSDDVGRKRGTLAFCIIYALGALSTMSSSWSTLFLGRILGGMGTALLFSAPESWLVGEAQQQQQTGDDESSSTSNAVQYLGQTFGWAYAGDSIVAILAGQMAGWAASLRGPTGPFQLSTAFLGLGALFTLFLWKENRAERQSQPQPTVTAAVVEASPVEGMDETSTTDAPTKSAAESSSSTSTEATSSNDNRNINQKPTIRDAIEVVKKDPKIILVGAVQSLFEAAMYIFVLQWPPAMRAAITNAFDANASVPYGTIFSCFMACCLIGSTLFGQLVNNKGGSNDNDSNKRSALTQEQTTSWMLTVAALAMTGATMFRDSLVGLIPAFFVFEACVGMYFPSIGLLRSKYVPDSHRTVIMNLFGIPLNILVVTVFLSIQRLGLQGAFAISSSALALAAFCMFRLRALITKSSSAQTATAV